MKRKVYYMPYKTTASFFDIIQFSLLLPFLAWKQRKLTYALNSLKFNATVTTHKMKYKTDTYIFRLVQSIQCETFNIF